MSSPAFLRPARAVTPMAFVRAIVRGYERYGADPSEALRAAQITPRELARPDARVTAAQFEVLSEHAMQELDDAFREFCLVTSLRFMHGYMCWAIDSRISLRQAGFPFSAPAHRDAYASMFTPEVQFDAACASIAFDERYLALPLQRDERALRTMLKRALPLTILQYRRDRLLGQRVRELLRSRAGEVTTAEALAALLNVSSRTLHRQLHEEGMSLQALKNEVRHEMAVEQLRRTARPIKQVALAVGFRNEKSFARAFLQWTGQAPSDFRLQQQKK